MDRDRPIKSSGKYNMNFVDWDNEYESVMDHISGIMERGLSYEENPYFDVPLSEVEFLMRDTYDCTSTGLTDSEISRLPRIRGTSRDCSICLTSSFDGIRLPCNHVFHADCIIRWLKCRVDCPNCRRSARDQA